MILVKHEQQKALSEQISNITKNKKVPKPFQKLNIFTDDKGILRVGGRLHYCALVYDPP